MYVSMEGLEELHVSLELVYEPMACIVKSYLKLNGFVSVHGKTDPSPRKLKIESVCFTNILRQKTRK